MGSSLYFLRDRRREVLPVENQRNAQLSDIEQVVGPHSLTPSVEIIGLRKVAISLGLLM